jgi:hypothetical protein
MNRRGRGSSDGLERALVHAVRWAAFPTVRAVRVCVGRVKRSRPAATHRTPPSTS